MKKLLCVCMALVLLCACGSSTKDDHGEKQTNTEKTTKDEVVDVTFSAVGDNLIHGAIYYYNNDGNGHYEFKDIYEHTNYLTQNADISYINQETICGGTELGLSHYPSFNGPYEVLDAVNSAGFNWMAASSNHTMDAGTQGILNQLNYMKTHYPNITITGSHASEEDAKKLQIIEIKGVKFGVLGYTYGLNGYMLPEGKEYMIDLIDKDKIKKDVTALKKVSDVVVVSMHWGQEYQFAPNDEQKELAQFLSDLGVDVIIGEDPHVSERIDYLTGKINHKTLVINTLGNLLSAQDQTDNMLGGMARFTIQYNKTKKKTTIKDVEFWPTVTYIGGNFQSYRTYVLKDYTNELAATHTLTTYYQQDVTREYFINKVNAVMNDKVKIVY